MHSMEFHLAIGVGTPAPGRPGSTTRATPRRGWSFLSQCHCSWVTALQLLCSQPRLLPAVLQPGTSSWACPCRTGSVPPCAWHCAPAPQPGCAQGSSLSALSDLGFGAPEEQLSMKSLMFKGRFGLFHILLSLVTSSMSCLVIQTIESWI